MMARVQPRGCCCHMAAHACKENSPDTVFPQTIRASADSFVTSALWRNDLDCWRKDFDCKQTQAMRQALAGTQNAQIEQRCQNMPAMHSSSAGQVSLCLQQPPRNPEEKVTPPRPPLPVPALAALVKQSLQAAPTLLLLPPVLSLSFPASCCQLTQLMLQLLFAHMAPSHSAGRSHCVTPEVWLW